MFDLREVFRQLDEIAGEEDKHEVISISVDLIDSVLNEVTSTILPISSIDEQSIEEWYNFASTVEGIVDNYCDVVNISISKQEDSVSEYIDFYVYDKNGNKKNYLIDMRLSNHASTTNGRENRKRKASRIDSNYKLLGITVNENTFYSYSEAVNYIRKLLAEESML